MDIVGSPIQLIMKPHLELRPLMDPVGDTEGVD